VRRLRRRTHSPKRDHDGHAQGISVTLIARRPLGFQGTRGGPGAGPGWTAGAEAVGHAAALELPPAGQRELGSQDTWRPRGCPRPGSGSWVRRTRGGPGAAPGRATELGPQDTWRSRSWPSVLTWSLYAGVPGLQGTDIFLFRIVLWPLLRGACGVEKGKMCSGGEGEIGECVAAALGGDGRAWVRPSLPSVLGLFSWAVKVPPSGRRTQPDYM
jgi:hypothetical protein